MYNSTCKEGQMSIFIVKSVVNSINLQFLYGIQ